ncbi:MAG: BlaI/MecI/CopY family transcriptional regulator, partial [Bacteroidales bacterium]|nr:BlaI/MecI/CopY family transcriptional regulator [Bacteroidales bacterium]
MKELTKAEEQVMQVLWQIKQGFAADIIANFPEPKPAY